MNRFLHTIDWISLWSGRVFSYLLLATMLVIGFEVFMRLFDKPQLWAFDVTLFCAGTTYVVGGAYTLLHNRHVKMDVLYARLSPRTQSILDCVTLPGFVVFCGILLWLGAVRGWESVLAREAFFSAFEPPVWPFKLMIPLGGFLILLQGLAKAIRDFHMITRGKSLD